ncbi:MAG: Type 3 secretion system secretin [Legionellaceae bacterium]
MNGHRILFVLMISVTTFFSGCTPPLYKKIERNISDTQAELSNGHTLYDTPKLPLQTITPNNITLTSGQSYPQWLNKHVSVRGVNMPFELFVNRIIGKAGGIANYENDINRSFPITLNYSGTMKGALDALAAKTNYAYEFNGNTIIWSSFVIKTFDISFMPGASQYLLGRSTANQSTTPNSSNSTNIASGFSNNNQYSSLQGSLSVWNDLKRALESMKSPEGQITVSEATTTVTIRDKPQNIRTMANYLASMDKNMSQQVALDIQVLEIELNKSFNYGVNWGLVRNFINNNYLAHIGGADSTPYSTSNAGQAFNLQGLGGSTATLGIGILGKAGLWEGSNIFINAISQQGKVSVSTQPRVITLNNQVAEIGINHQTTYLSQVTTNQTLNVGTSVTMTPGVVSSGFSLYILPKIQGNNVYLQISSTLSNLEKLDKISFGDQNNSIQLPVLAEKRFNQRSVVPTGSTLVLAGFKQLGNQANKITLFESEALGGKGGHESNVETIVLITPTVVKVNS